MSAAQQGRMVGLAARSGSIAGLRKAKVNVNVNVKVNAKANARSALGRAAQQGRNIKCL